MPRRPTEAVGLGFFFSFLFFLAVERAAAARTCVTWKCVRWAGGTHSCASRRRRRRRRRRVSECMYTRTDFSCCLLNTKSSESRNKNKKKKGRVYVCLSLSVAPPPMIRCSHGAASHQVCLCLCLSNDSAATASRKRTSKAMSRIKNAGIRRVDNRWAVFLRPLSCCTRKAPNVAAAAIAARRT